MPYFIGEEQGTNIEPAVIGCEKGWPFLGEMLSYYENRHFIDGEGFDMVTLPIIMSERIRQSYEYKKINDISQFTNVANVLCVLPATWFSPKFPNSYKCEITEDTYAVHHFAASWYPVDKKLFRIIRKIFGYRFAHICSVSVKWVKSLFIK